MLLSLLWTLKSVHEAGNSDPAEDDDVENSPLEWWEGNGESTNEDGHSESDDDWFDQLVQDNVEEIPPTQPDPEDLPALGDMALPDEMLFESQWRMFQEKSPSKDDTGLSERPVARPLQQEFAVAAHVEDTSTNGISGAPIPPNPSPGTSGVPQDQASSSKADRIAILKAKLQELDGLIQKTESEPLLFDIFFQFFRNSGYVYIYIYGSCFFSVLHLWWHINFLKLEACMAKSLLDIQI